MHEFKIYYKKKLVDKIKAEYIDDALNKAIPNLIADR